MSGTTVHGQGSATEQRLCGSIASLKLTMKFVTGSSVGWLAGLPGHELGAGLGHPNWGWSSSAVSSTPSLGSEQPPCVPWMPVRSVMTWHVIGVTTKQTCSRGDESHLDDRGVVGRNTLTRRPGCRSSASPKLLALQALHMNP